MDIQGEQVILSHLTVQDLEFMSRIECDSDLWYFEESVASDPLEVRDKYRGRLQADGDPGSYDFVVRRSGDPERTPVGIVQLWEYVPHRGSYELGYAVLPEYAGLGYGTEATRLLLGFAFEQLKAHKVVGMCNGHNQRSNRLMAGLGMVREGIFKEELVWQGRRVDQYFYSILAREFVQQEG